MPDEFPDDIPRTAGADGAARPGESLGCGLGCGTVAIAILAVGAVAVSSGSTVGTAVALAVAAAVAFAIGWGLRHTASSEDAQNAARQSAPEIAPSLGAPGERVWFEGVVVCPQPRIAPHFGVACAWLRYRVTEGSGKSRRLVTQGREVARTWIDTEAGRYEVDLERVTLHRLPKWTGSEGRQTYEVTWLPVGWRVGVCGVVTREPRAPEPEPQAPPAAPPGRAERPEPSSRAVVDEDFQKGAARETESFETGRVLPEVAPPQVLVAGDTAAPLLVTRLERADWNTHVETDEAGKRTGGIVMQAGAVALAAMAAGVVCGGWDVRAFEPWVGCAGLAVACWFVLAGRDGVRRVAAARARAEDAAAALETDLAHADTDLESAGARVAARLRTYDFFASEHNRLLASGAGGWLARRRGDGPLPLRG